MILPQVLQLEDAARGDNISYILDGMQDISEHLDVVDASLQDEADSSPWQGCVPRIILDSDVADALRIAALVSQSIMQNC
jgi:hypothetical protein